MNTEEIARLVKSNKKVMPIGGGSKSALSGINFKGVASIPMSQMNGIIEYEPDEYTITARAGTPIKTLVEAVEANNQYLPFDPLFVGDGATLGGTVAANTGGSGRYRYGGVRDFILGIYFVDGQGNIVRGGGKVVKNASGFDLPKFMVGSLGRYGILTEITMKIFPKPAAYQSLEVEFASLEDALNCTFALANQPFEMDAIDFRRRQRDGRETTMWIRLGGLVKSLPERLDRLADWLKKNTAAITVQEKPFDKTFWDGINQVDWATNAENLIKIPISPRKVKILDRCNSIQNIHYFSAGNSALATADDLEGLGETLTHLKLNGLLLRGDKAEPILGEKRWMNLAKRVKAALDPEEKFLGV